MSKKVIIIGAGGHAKVIADIVNKLGDEVVGFLDDNIELQNKVIYDGKKNIGTLKDINKYKDLYFIIGIGNNKVRKKIDEEHNLKWYTAIHPNAVIASDVIIGEGTVVMAGTVINSSSNIGRHCIINTRVSIDHDNQICDYVHISPGATLAGTVTIKELSWVCAGATIINNITVEKNNVIGAGAVLVRNITENNSTYVGVPAKKLLKTVIK